MSHQNDTAKASITPLDPEPEIKEEKEQKLEEED